jgi:hypothetical protein
MFNKGERYASPNIGTCAGDNCGFTFQAQETHYAPPFLNQNVIR